MKPVREILQRTRRIALPIAIFMAAAGLLWFVNGHEPLEQWLVWPYVGFALAAACWLLSCLSVGHAALRALAIRLPFRERLLFDVAVGVLLFAVGIFVAGLFRLLHPPFFFVYPIVLFAVGARWMLRDLRRAWRHLRAARRRLQVPPSLPYFAALALGTLSLAIVYLTILVPDNVAFDARTYHLPIAEHYAAWGRIGKFPEGWYAGVLPHLSSWLYTWPFTLRSVNLFGHVEIAAHMELALFVVTVFSAPLLVAALCPGRRVRGSWAVFFLFPGLFLYDSSLGVAADHVLAFWAIPLALALRRLAQRPSPATGALVGLMMAGAAMTKYQAVYLIAPAALFVAIITVRELWRARRGRGRMGVAHRGRSILAPPAALALVALVATTPHWLANVVWYGNPVFPMLRHLFPSHPMVPGWPGPWMDAGFQPTGTTFMQLRETLTSTFTLGFVVHDFPFHRDVPVFGFLFTLTWPILLLVPGGRRALVLVAGTLLAYVIYYWTFHEDRYLQAILPWMVATTAAALVLAWQAGMAARVGIVLLVAAQVVWGGDVPWLPSHAMMGGDVPAIRSLRLLSSTYRGDLSARWQYDTGFEALDRLLPKRAVVLLHEEYMKLGLNRRAVADSIRWQGAIDYRQLARPDRVHDLLRSMEVTHLLWNRARSPVREIPVAGELVFFDYALRYGEDRRDVGEWGVARLPAKRPPATPPGLVLYAACNGPHTVRLEDLDRAVAEQANGLGPGGDLQALLPSAQFAVVDSRCHGDVPALRSSFIEAPRWGDLTLWVRR